MVVMASGGRREGKAGLRISGGFVTWPLPCNVSHLFPSVCREHGWVPESSRCCWTYVLNEWWDSVAAVEAISIGCGFLFPHHVFITWQVGWFVSPLECELGQIFATSFFPLPGLISQKKTVFPEKGGCPGHFICPDLPNISTKNASFWVDFSVAANTTHGELALGFWRVTLCNKTTYSIQAGAGRGPCAWGSDFCVHWPAVPLGELPLRLTSHRSQATKSKLLILQTKMQTVGEPM